MKRCLLLTLSLPLLVGCNPPSNGDGTVFKAGQNVQTRNYKNIEADEIHPEVDDGYVRISSVLINLERFIDDFEEETTYLYKLSCKNSSDSFQTHLFNSDSDGFYYAEISKEQHNYIPNGFNTLRNKDSYGSSVEISIIKIYECISYRELYYSESEQKIKVVDFDHVIPGLEESEVNSLLGKSVDYYVYVDESGIKSQNHGNHAFETQLIIQYIDVSESTLNITD